MVHQDTRNIIYLSVILCHIHKNLNKEIVNRLPVSGAILATSFTGSSPSRPQERERGDGKERTLGMRLPSWLEGADTVNAREMLEAGYPNT